MALENGPRFSKSSLIAGAAAFRILEGGRGLFAEVLQPLRRRPQFAHEAGQSGKACFRFGQVARRGLRDRVAVFDEPGDVLAVRRERRQRAVGFDREVREHAVLVGEDLQHAVEFAQARVGPFDHFVQFAAVPGEACSKFVEDDPQRLRLGQTVDVLQLVNADGALGVAERQQKFAFAFLSGGDAVQRWRQRNAFGMLLGRQAVDVLLAQQRLRQDRAFGVGAEVLEAGVFDVQLHRRLALRRGGHFPDFADFRAVRLDFLAFGDVVGVVEDRAHGVGAVGSAGGGREQDRDDHHGQSSRGR